MTLPVLSVRDLYVSFPTQEGVVQAVRGVSFDIEQHELLGVVGESGSGKSVTFLAVMGLLPRSAIITGSIKVGGEELVGRLPDEVRHVRGKQVAMIFQDPLTALNPVHRVGAQVVEMILAHQQISKDEAAAKAVELLGPRGDSAARCAGAPVPPRVLGRDAAESRDRDGDRQLPGDPDR